MATGTSLLGRREPAAQFRLLPNSFKEGGKIPDKHAWAGGASPGLVWTGQPAETKGFALIMEDVEDVKVAGETKVHWLLYGIGPGVPGLDAGIPRQLQLESGMRQGRNDFGEIGYHGPDLPAGTSHRYSFKLHALNKELVLKIGADKTEFTKALRQAGIAATAELKGFFKSEGTVAPAQNAAAEQKDRDAMPRWEQASLDFLKNDKEFDKIFKELERRLKEACSTDPAGLRQFFRRFSFTSSFGSESLDEYLNTVTSQDRRRLFEDYVKFANRFRVRLRLLKTAPFQLQLRAWPPFGKKFHVKIVDGHLEPVKASAFQADSPYRDFFAAPNLVVLEEIQRLLDVKLAKFVQVEDGPPGYSLLKDLELFAYQPDGVTIILHNAEQPYLAFIFGEQMMVTLLARLGPTITEFKKKYFGRVPPGRPPKKKP